MKPDIGRDTGAFNSITQTVPTGQTMPVLITGSFVRCISASGPFKLGIDGLPSGQFAQGLKFKMPPGTRFSQLTLDNTAGAAPLTVTLSYGYGDVDDSRVSGTTNVSTAIGANAIPNRMNVTNAVGGVQIDATPGRQSITIQNLDGAESIFLGKDNTVTVANGYPLGPGQDITIDHSNGPIFGISIAATVAIATLVEV